MHATDIIAYTFQAEILCPSCTLDTLNVPNSLRQEQDHESIIETLADAHNIDWQDEYSYDSDEFPKIVFASQIEDDEYCGNCHELII